MSTETGIPRTLPTLRRRAEFLAVAATGKKWVTPGLILQIGKADNAPVHPRFGLTATKKIGNAVTRNRARRRLRALAQQMLRQHAVPRDYVLIARFDTATRDFETLRKDLTTALRKTGCWHD
ncbi:MAG: ribonuclease P protein component [Alphaproteobacteria bacterium]|nr:ribonuclease P protein component [Alphaproteobacteria bacterium]